jgi:hypothetical protein
MDAEQEKPEKKITIFVNNQPVEFTEEKATGAEIKAKAGVPAQFKLYDSKGKEIADGKSVELKDKEKFTAISGQDVS